MTPTRQAACATLLGLTSAVLVLTGRAQQDTSPPAPYPAPVVRVAPGPRPAVSPHTAHPQQATTPVQRTSPLHPSAGGTTGVGGAAETKPKIIVHTDATAGAAQPKAPSFSATGLNRNVIVLDPAHGGADSGARIGDSTLEKNVTLAFAFRLRSLLTARGFTVVLTRDSDAATEPNTPSTPLTLDDRAGIANHARAAACLLLHATGRGVGVHLYSSELDAAPAEATPLPWLTAQAAWVPASQALEGQLSGALGRSRIPLVSSTASVRPEDSLTCPALVLELAPEDDTPGSVNDASYQERVANAIAGALVFWQNTVQSPAKLPTPARLLRSPVKHTEAPAAGAEAQP